MKKLCTSQFSNESICSTDQIAIQANPVFTIEFNLYDEVLKQKIYNSYKRFIKEFNIDENTYKSKITSFIKENDVTKLDNNNLVPDQFKLFCTHLGIDYIAASDDYYKFIFNDYAKTILQLRKSLGMNQKQFAKACGISPVDIYKFETNNTSPSFFQYKKLKTYYTYL